MLHQNVAEEASFNNPITADNYLVGYGVEIALMMEAVRTSET
jgi:hypothetical protein